ATYMTAKEVSLIAGIPMKEVPGLALIEGVEFGLNIDKTADGVKLGNVIYRGRKLEKEEIKIDRNILNKHVFITGVTGSGKTTATQRLLMESRLPFFVIEPAKDEYRELLSRFKELKDEFVIFTPGDETGAPFRFNPFELIQGELITSHIDMLRAAFMSAFTMEAAMPQLIEEALYNIYKNYGWNINSNKNKYCDSTKDQNAPWRSDGIYWPDFSDLIVELKKVVKGHGFGERLEAEYIGSLVSRLNNFMVGGKGAMFNCKNSVDFSELLDKKVIFELEEIKAPEDKALIMGFILTRLIAAVKARYKKDKKGAVSHLIVVEEAHRLLSKYQIGDCAAKKDAVTMFADMLSEVRKYGEGIIIIDQIPNKLESDVLKNTNTKIVHRLFAQDDKEAVGATMAMDDSQKNFLSNLGVGEAVIFSESWNKPVHAKIDMAGEDAYGVSDNGGNEGSWEPEKVETVEELIKKAGIRQLTENKAFLFPAFKRASLKLNDGGDLIDGAVLKKYGDDINELIMDFNSLCGEIKSKISAQDLSGPFDIGGADGPLMKKITCFVKFFNKFIAGFDGNDSGNENGIKGARLKKIKETVRLAVNYDIIYKRGPWLFNEHARGLLSDIIKTSAKRLVFSEDQSFEELLDCAAEVAGEFIDKILDACKNDGNADSLKALSEFLSASNENKRRIALKM
ncbi:MAG TPA: ATP-binding protein, partial [Candidatus Wallbacteria bacterium]|nr:ATP-binding protein [Candidatus Wallbacteria bacterium]